MVLAQSDVPPPPRVRGVRTNHPAAQLNYTPRLLERLSPNPASQGRRRSSFMAEGRLQRGRCTTARRRSNRGPTAGFFTVPQNSLRPNVIRGPKWVRYMYDSESCQGISAGGGAGGGGGLVKW